MKQARQKLLYIYLFPMAISLLIAISFETGIITEGGLTGASDGQTEFSATMLMELITLCSIPVALRLFKFKAIEARLKDSPRQLLRFGSVRILMLGAPMAINLLLYYLFLSATFGYMTLILFLAMTFVYPSESRCQNETNPTEE